jgi:putative multiple sugar transport system permease protein
MVSETTTVKSGQSVGDYLRKNIREYGLLVALVVIMLFFQVLTGGVLFGPSISPTWCCRIRSSSSWRWACC